MFRLVEFGGGVGTEIPERDSNLVLGNKGAGLVKMSRFDIPVPPGFILTTHVCKEFNEFGKKIPKDLGLEIDRALKKLHQKVGRQFGDTSDPLLVSVRSGAPVSMPGMMDTILNLGLTHKGVEGFAKTSGDEAFAWDTYRRFLQMFGEIVLEVPGDDFDSILTKKRKEAKVANDIELGAKTLKNIAEEFQALIEKKTGNPFPDSPREQLILSIEAVFKSWNNRRAVKYREINQIPEHYGTGVIVQSMVYGNRGPHSGTGVLFTRNPATGAKGLYGEYMMRAQGEDIVSGVRTPQPINAGCAQPGFKGTTLETEMPKVYEELLSISHQLEMHERDMQDIEFTIEENKLWILQTRRGKRTARAALKIATEMVEEHILNQKEAVLRMTSKELDRLLHPIFDPAAKRVVLAKGLPASPGAASGKIVFTADEAERRAKKGEKVLLVRNETSPEDIHGMQAAQGILTSRGGMTSHAAVVARGMGKCCIAGCSQITVHASQGYLVTHEGKKIKEGEMLSLDGSEGEVLEGEVPTTHPTSDHMLEHFLSWADQYRKLKIRANADTPGDCRVARKFGAQGVGLCRTEHMFFEKERINSVRKMILAEKKEDRVRYLNQIFPMQLKDFREIFKEMEGLPVTIRLLDPPLHEFLPRQPDEIAELAKQLEMKQEDLASRIDKLHEFNPMLGHRGCRLAITYPEIYEMQVRAIMTAAIEQKSNPVEVEIMLPLVMHVKELEYLKKMVVAEADRVKNEHSSSLRYRVGTMIELPRAAMVAREIAKRVEFFSFGTNDLTQTVCGLSRDDSAQFFPAYLEKGIFLVDPFSSIDVDGVLPFVKMGTEEGRAGNPRLKVGVCGEHGGDPASIAHFNHLGFDYISCSPMRVPIARLAAAQAALVPYEI